MLTTRFAPSPTGHLHLGHAYAALLAFEWARSSGARFLLRIEDIDAGRCRPEFEQAIYDDLTWLGIRWDGPPIRQSERLALYEERLQHLIQQGYVYRCFRTRKEIEDILGAPHGAPSSPYRGGPLTPDEERALLDQKRPYSWRLWLAALDAAGLGSDLCVQEMQDSGQMHTSPARSDTFGDIILSRKDAGTSYHIASVTDDITSGVTHIIRGEDLREAAGLHRLLYAVFGAPPPIYMHHRLILGPDGKRLAKRDHATTLRHLRENGASPDDIAHMLGLRRA